MSELPVCTLIPPGESVSHLNPGVSAGQLGELDTAPVVYVPQTHLPGNTETSETWGPEEVSGQNRLHWACGGNGPALWGADDVLLVAAGAGFRQAGDGGRVAEQHRSGTDLEAETNQSEERTENTLLLETEEELKSLKSGWDVRKMSLNIKTTFIALETKKTYLKRKNLKKC